MLRLIKYPNRIDTFKNKFLIDLDEQSDVIIVVRERDLWWKRRRTGKVRYWEKTLTVACYATKTLLLLIQASCYALRFQIQVYPSPFRIEMMMMMVITTYIIQITYCQFQHRFKLGRFWNKPKVLVSFGLRISKNQFGNSHSVRFGYWSIWFLNYKALKQNWKTKLN